MSPLPRPRVVLVEDNVSIAEFVALALEEQPIELISCTRVDEALAAFGAGPVHLLITDLMLPGESGVGLLERLHARPQGLDGLLTVVLSAGLTPAVRQQLQALQVWRLLSKPVSLSAIEACVVDALQHPSARPVTTALEAPAPEGPLQPGHPSEEADELAAIAAHFAGDKELFASYRDSCLQQFPHDIRQGDAAILARDWPGLQRLAHSLATVLTTLGRPEQGRLARALEDTAAQAKAACTECVAQWAALRARIPLPPGTTI